ncbi:MAG: glycine dehydrogenase, partial [Geodermatophilaceae bacterium]|nr:glycine dehydrogenase [Geodermatophilaceae bacterium]
MTTSSPAPMAGADSFVPRHVGPSAAEIAEMLATIGYASLDELIDATIPRGIRLSRPLAIRAGRSEHEALAALRTRAAKNRVFRSYLGYGYHDTLVPPVIQRNILENPGWYTAYTPYQAEISQGRLEALLNFQTMVIDLTGLEIANASLLDEGTAAAEAMSMAYQAKGSAAKNTFYVDARCHPQTIAVVQTRARARGIETRVADMTATPLADDAFGALLQYPTTDGEVLDYAATCDAIHRAGALAIVAADLMSLVLLTPPGEWGADVCVGNSQRFGVPLGYGGPHAAFFATRDEFKRILPGRIIGVSRDASGRPALRMALQTREQHIRREKATSNVCTAQVLLAVIAGMYAVWHGPEGLSAIARRIHRHAVVLAAGLEQLGHSPAHDVFFDTLCVELAAGSADAAIAAAAEREINIRRAGDDRVIVALDETVTDDDVQELLTIFAAGEPAPETSGLADDADERFDERFARTSPFLTHPVFGTHHSETEMLRYMRTLESRDLSLTHSMIPLGSCTMKLNATAEMFPISWPEFSKLHPFAPVEQARGYGAMFAELEAALAEITGFHAVSLQPNAGSQGEYAGLLAIASYHAS